MWGHAIIVFLTKLSRLCQHSVTALSPRCHHITITSPPHCHHITITSPTHRRHIAATSPPHFPPQLPRDLISANKVLFWPNRTLLAEIRSCQDLIGRNKVPWQLWRRCGGNVAAMRRRGGGDVAAMWRRCGGDVAAMWQRCGGDVAAMWRRCGGDVVAMWWQCDDHTTTTFFTILTMKGQWHDDGNIL